MGGFDLKFYCVGYPTDSNGYYLHTLTPDDHMNIDEIYFPGQSYFNAALGKGSCNNYFGLVITGKIAVHEPGQYTFETNSDDGSRLYINNDLIVDNWGVHPARSMNG